VHGLILPVSVSGYNHIRLNNGNSVLPTVAYSRRGLRLLADARRHATVGVSSRSAMTKSRHIVRENPVTLICSSKYLQIIVLQLACQLYALSKVHVSACSSNSNDTSLLPCRPSSWRPHDQENRSKQEQVHTQLSKPTSWGTTAVSHATDKTGKQHRAAAPALRPARSIVLCYNMRHRVGAKLIAAAARARCGFT
jgi:hypothetical protein